MKKTKESKPARQAFDAADFSQLSEFLRAYLHEDYKEEYVSAPSALEDFLHCASPKERKNLRLEFDAFMRLAAGAPFKQVQTWWTRELGSAWLPADKNALLGLQQVLTQTDKEKK